MNEAHSQKAGSSPTRCVIRRGGLSRVLGLACIGLTLLVPGASADDSQPTAQAKAIRGEFLANLPAPSTGAKAICVVDTGLSFNSDLGVDNVISRAAVDGATIEDVGTAQHGTRVAMSAVGKSSNGWGSAGIWPAGKVISVRASTVSDADHYTWQNYIDGFDECNYQATITGTSLGAINLSLGFTSATEAQLTSLEEAVNAEKSSGGTGYNTSVVASAGNDSASTVGYPARFNSAFAVGATSALTGGFCDFSNRGTGLDISAAGCSNDGSNADGTLADWSGTSFSAPITSAVLAALRSYKPDLTATSAEQVLLDTAQTTIAGPVVDASAAFRAQGLGALVDQYTPATSSTDSSSSSSSPTSTTASESATTTTTTRSLSYSETSEVLYPWTAPTVKAQWRKTNGTVVVKLREVPNGVQLEADNGGTIKTYKLKGSNPIVQIRQDRLMKQKIKIRYIGDGGSTGHITKVSGYWPLPGRCISSFVEEACYTSKGKERTVTRRDRRAIKSAQRRWKKYEKRQEKLAKSLGA